MNTNGYTIRLERPTDRRAVEHMVRTSFWNVYRPGAYEHFVLHVMREHPDLVPALNLVMEKDEALIGQTVFVKSCIITDDGRSLPTLTLEPICIAPSYRRQSYGVRLWDFAFVKARDWGFGAVLFEGNIGFYRHRGCVESSTYGIRHDGLPEGEDASFFLCRELTRGYLDGISGIYRVPAVYDVADGGVAAFDATFPPKE